MTNNSERIRLLVDSVEGEHCEFKEAKTSFEFDKLLQYCSALANEGGGRIVLGVTDRRPRRVVGTNAFPQFDKIRTGLMEKLHLRVEVEEVISPEGRVLIFTVPTRPIGLPVGIDGRFWVRHGESLAPMPQDRLREVFDEIGHDFSGDICLEATWEDLDLGAIEDFRQRWGRKSGNRGLASQSSEQLLEDAEAIVGGHITYAGLVLFGTRKALGRHLPQSEVVFEYRSSESAGPAQDRKEYRQAFFCYYEELWDYVNRRNDLQHFQDGLFVWDIPTFDNRSIREAVLNAVAHRDYRLIPTS